MDTNNAKNSQTYEFPPSPYGTYFELKTNHFQLEEATRSGSFDMKYRHYHSTYEIYYLLEGSRYYLIEIASLSNQEALFSSAKTGFTKPLQLSNIFIIAS